MLSESDTTRLHARKVQLFSRQFPLDFDRATHGIYQRLRMILEACRDTGGNIQAVFLVPNATLPLIDTAKYQTLFRERWNIPLTLQFVPYVESGVPSWGDYYLRPILSAEHNDDYAATAALRDRVGALLCPDAAVVVAHRLNAAMPVLQAAGDRDLRVPIVVDIDDIEHKKLLREYLRPPFWPGKLLKLLHVPAVALAERSNVRHAAMSLVCSETDRRYLERLTGSPRVAVLPNAVDLSAAPEPDALPPLTDGPVVLFVGTYTHRPNVDAAEYLINEVFPLIRQRLPEARLKLVGPKVEALPSFRLSPAGVVFEGFVPDLTTVWNTAGVMCCAIRAGGGTRIKIIEAAAMGVPVVSTTIGAEGLEFRDGHGILLRDTARELAHACVDVLTDRALANSLRRDARSHVARFDRREVISKLRCLLLRAASVQAANQ